MSDANLRRLVGYFYLEFEDGEIGRSKLHDLESAVATVVRYERDDEARRKEHVKRAWAVQSSNEGLQLMCGAPPPGWTVDLAPDRDAAS